MEILPKELIFRFLIASDMGRRPKYSWQLLLFIINSPNRQKLEKRKTQRGRHARRHFFSKQYWRLRHVSPAPRLSASVTVCAAPTAQSIDSGVTFLGIYLIAELWWLGDRCGAWFGCSPDMLRLFVQCCLRQMSREVSCRCSNDRVNVFIFYYLHL